MHSIAPSNAGTSHRYAGSPSWTRHPTRYGFGGSPRPSSEAQGRATRECSELAQAEPEIAGGVVVADILHHGADEVEVGRQEPLFHLGAEEVAEDATEVLVAGVGEEGAAVGKHADELAEEALVGEDLDLTLHAVFLVKEPPAAAELHLAGRHTVLEVADHRAEDVVHRWIQIVEDCLGEAIVAIKAIEES